MTAPEMTLTHLWQEQRLGIAPFEARCILSLPSSEMAEKNPSGYANVMAEVSRAAAGLGVHLGCCNSCGAALMNNVVIRDVHGKHFVVGCDCARKTHDTKVITKIEAMQREKDRAEREAKRQAEWEARAAARRAAEQAERNRNGGLTDAETAAAKRQAEEDATAQASIAANTWLIEALSGQFGDFVLSMRQELSRKPISSLSGRMLNVLAEIYAKKMGGRRGSKKYDAAYDEFWVKAGIPQE